MFLRLLDRRLWVSLLCVCAASLEARAQHVSAEALRPLEFMIGEWDVDVEARLSRSGPWETSKGRSVTRWIAGKSVIQDDFTGTRQGREFVATTWLANDNRTSRYQKVFVDSDHGVLVLYEGRLESKLMTLVTAVDIDGARILQRSQYTLISNDLFTVDSARSTDNGATWDRTGTLKYSRKSK